MGKKKRYRILWHRVIIAAAVMIAVLIGIVMLISTIVGTIKNALGGKDDSSVAVGANASASDTSGTGQSEGEDDPPEDYKLTVVIDAGHGGSDVGATDASEIRYEKDDDLRLAIMVQRHLRDMDVNVIMTRSTDIYVSLDDRCEIANDANADLFVSLHRNHAEGTAHGVEVWVHNDQPETDTALAQNILDGLESVGISENRNVNFGYVGQPDANYQVNRETDMPSCLVEMGFIQNEEDNHLFDVNCDAYAKAIAEAIYKTAREAGMIDDDEVTSSSVSSDSQSDISEQ